MNSRPRRICRILLPLAAAGLLGACSGSSGALVVQPGTVPMGLHRSCAALQRLLPQTLLGLQRRATSPASDLVTAWGDPAVTLWCATALPPQLDPASPSYDPAGKRSTSIDAAGVCWLVNETERPPNAHPLPYTFTTVQQRITLQLHVPKQYYGAESPLPRLASVVTRTDPADPAQHFSCS
jgi:hypothetical protein